jgi:RNA methyltransferase, TrmH family
MIETMISKSTIKYIQSLQHKKFRDQYQRFVAEGPKVVEELLLDGSFRCDMIYATADWKGFNHEELNKIYDSNIERIETFQLEKISGLSTPNQVLAVLVTKEMNSPPVNNLNLLLALDHIQDPGNFGTIIRIADWFGIGQIICSPGTADQYNPKVVQSTMASLGRVEISYTPLEDWLKNISIKKYAAALNGKPLKSFHKIQQAVIIIGNESKGISPEILELCDEKITIQKFGIAESLNAAVATGIILNQLKGE